MSKTLRIVAAAFLFVVIPLALVGCSEDADVTPVAPPAAEPAEVVSADDPPLSEETAAGSVEVVYFHIANPCDCMAVFGEAVADSINANFEAELASGVVSFVDVVSDDPANVATVEDFDSQPSDIFVVTRVGDVTSVEPDYDIWSLMGDNEAVAQYVKSLVETKLAELA